MDARIRPVERRDAFSLAALRIQHDRELGRPPRPGFITEYADAFLAEIDDHRGWIAEEADGNPVGCLLALRVRKLPTLMAPGRPEWWYVQSVFVCTDRRRQGIGAALLTEVRRAARDEGVRWLELRSSDAGRPLFEHGGFTTPSPRLMQWTP
ncbi:GNAT family N-acetyltransferase [Janibacter sp. YIM B02568]|jgi:GNAT superfamily N-acetyltransferase|uniref:GNAT family N-acetyltransferase n=1 Tax=Janibacter endophyticus TaxID=2806261 RepID=UPI00194E392A|nr:GNAT family N-acetyltransferase [Janibacter endophyticus]MBM6546315.1 GNAT family N-acetyltransferase [Janibacter endophyticus]